MNDTLAPRNRQLALTHAVLADALEKHRFDFGVFISVVVTPDGTCKVELALSGDGPQSLERTIPEVMRRLAVEVETRMKKQGRDWLRSMS